jgi:hypothetical protein
MMKSRNKISDNNKASTSTQDEMTTMKSSNCFNINDVRYVFEIKRKQKNCFGCKFMRTLKVKNANRLLSNECFSFILPVPYSRNLTFRHSAPQNKKGRQSRGAGENYSPIILPPRRFRLIRLLHRLRVRQRRLTWRAPRQRIYRRPM